jgi:phosphoribosyl-ATP pyrophosphohydrolase/phosphoribosyl-AMP cyclohydrolase
MSDELRAAIIQDDATGRVLMLGYMDAEAEAQTRATGHVHFFSRSRQRLWEKGETSGNYLNVVAITPDCDRDALLVRVAADGPTCHDGTTSCFTPWLWRTIVQRDTENDPASYTVQLLRGDRGRLAQKVGEEGVETVVAALSESDERVVSEIADLWYHALVLLRARGLDPAAVEDELLRRHRA